VPQIIVTADRGAAFREGAVTLRERVTVADFESEHSALQLLERLGWAVGDAVEAERVGEPTAASPDPTAASPDPTGASPDPIGASPDPIDAPPEPMTDPVESLSVPSRA
jgi:hypothetical protein